MNQYQKLIAAGKIKDCIDAFLEIKGEVYEKTILLSARWTRNERDNLLGILDPRDYTVSRNQIVNVLNQIALDLKGNNVSTTTPSVEFEISNAYTRENILVLIQHYSRRDPESSQRFKDCLEQFDSYQQAKIQYAGHDTSQRQFKFMKEGFEAFCKVALNVKLDNFEEEIAEIQSLISARVPSIEDLTKAYAIASGLGYGNSELERLLELPMHTNETRIKITEALEGFLKSL